MYVYILCSIIHIAPILLVELQGIYDKNVRLISQNREPKLHIHIHIHVLVHTYIHQFNIHIFIRI